MKVARYVTTVAAASLMAAGVFSTSTALAAETMGPVTDEVGVIKLVKGEPITIGAWMVLTGPDSAIGIDQKRGIEISVSDAGGELLGHPIRLMVEDSACTAEGGQTAALKIAGNQRVVMTVGATCSSASIPGVPILWKAGIPTIGMSSSAPMLTAPDRDPGYHGYVRVMYNDDWHGKEVANYVYNVVGARRVATLHDGSIVFKQLVNKFEATFKELGGTIVTSEAIAPTDVEFRPVLTKIAAAKPDFIFHTVFLSAGAHIARQRKQVSGLENVGTLATDAIVSRDFIEAAGEAVVGYRIGGLDPSEDTLGTTYPAYLSQYKETYGENPTTGYGVYAYDATQIALNAIRKVAVKGDDGNTYIGKGALRDALFATKDHVGLVGTMTCRPTGDCGIFNYAVFEYTNSDPETFVMGTNPKRVWSKDTAE